MVATGLGCGTHCAVTTTVVGLGSLEGLLNVVNDFI